MLKVWQLQYRDLKGGGWRDARAPILTSESRARLLLRAAETRATLDNQPRVYRII